MRATDAVGADLRAYLERTSAADQPRDSIHLRHQELVARAANVGGWRVGVEPAVADAGVADLLLSRGDDLALVEIWNWFADVGEAFRSWDRKLERLRARGTARVSGCWVVRSTRRNRQLLAASATLFSARFPAGGLAWLAALGDRHTRMPAHPAILWVTVRGDRLVPARIRAAPP